MTTRDETNGFTGFMRYVFGALAVVATVAGIGAGVGVRELATSLKSVESTATLAATTSRENQRELDRRELIFERALNIDVELGRMSVNLEQLSEKISKLEKASR